MIKSTYNAREGKHFNDIFLSFELLVPFTRYMVWISMKATYLYSFYSSFYQTSLLFQLKLWLRHYAS